MHAHTTKFNYEKSLFKNHHEFSSHNDVNLQDLSINRGVMHDAQSTLRLKATKYYTTTLIQQVCTMYLNTI